MDALNYLLLVNIYLILFYAFYALLLKNETFFKLNRIYLVGGAMMSFLIPFLQSEWIRALFITKQVEVITQNISLTFTGQEVDIQATEQNLTTGEAILLIYLAGTVFFLFRFFWQLYRVRLILNSGETLNAFSFFNKVMVGSNVPNRRTVYSHELVHARQWHSADVIMFEFISIVNWFNPVVYLYRKAVKYIHEFTADEIASQNEESKSAYAQVLVSKTFGISTNQLFNSFYNHSLLKRRIIMLHKSKSTRNALLKYGLSAPLFAGMMILSSATISNKVEEIEKGKMMNTDAVASSASLEDFTLPLIEISNSKRVNALLVDTVPGKNKVFLNPEKTPEYPGGMGAFYEYLSKNFKYTEEAKKNKVSGKIILAFIVETDGSLSDIKVLRGLGNGLDDEAIRVLAASSRWNPGTQKGKPVRVAYTLPFAVSTPGQKTGGTRSNNIDSLVISGAPNNTLYIVDGKEESSDVLKTLDKKSIKSVNVLKGESAITLYGDKGKNGVIEIYVNETPPATTQSRIGHPGEANIGVSESKIASGTLKNEASRKEKTSYTATDSLIYTRADVTLHGKGSNVELANYKGLIFLDEIEKIDKNLLKKIDPNTIESMKVLNNESAVKKYGKRGKDGAIEITTKKK